MNREGVVSKRLVDAVAEVPEIATQSRAYKNSIIE